MDESGLDDSEPASLPPKRLVSDRSSSLNPPPDLGRLGPDGSRSPEPSWVAIGSIDTVGRSDELRSFMALSFTSIKTSRQYIQALAKLQA